MPPSSCHNHTFLQFQSSFVCFRLQLCPIFVPSALVRLVICASCLPRLTSTPFTQKPALIVISKHTEASSSTWRDSDYSSGEEDVPTSSAPNVHAGKQIKKKDLTTIAYASCFVTNITIFCIPNGTLPIPARLFSKIPRSSLALRPLPPSSFPFSSILQWSHTGPMRPRRH